MLILIIIGYVLLVRYFAENDKHGLAKSLGEKQANILAAVHEGERIHSYSKIALQQANSEVSASYLCGDKYLGRRLVSTADCPETFTEVLDVAFTEHLTTYPGGSLADSFSPLLPDSQNPDLLISKAEKRIPINGGKLIGVGITDSDSDFTAAGGTFSGSIAGWPTNNKAITNYFGARDTGIKTATKNHGGMDISVGGKTGQPITSLTDGTATFYERGKNSFVQVVSGTLIIDYMHTRPSPPVIQDHGVAVRAGQQIAVSAPYSDSAPHLHLQVSSAAVSPGAAQSAWGNHVGSSSSSLGGTTYAVISADGSRAFLNPICFFDRAFIETVPRTGASARGDPYEACHAYEQSFGLSRRNAFNAAAGITPEAVPVASTTPVAADAPSSTPVNISDTVPAASPETSKFKYVRETYANLKEENLFEFIDKTAEDTGVDRVLLLSIITQESQGDKNARSPTGPAGIAQFSGGTAKEFMEKGVVFTKIQSCCDGTQAAAKVCHKLTICNEANDDRFNPRMSIEAQAILLKEHAKAYAAYDQKIPLILIAYNAGPSVVNQILMKSGINPKWDQLKSVIQNDVSIYYGDTVSNPAAKRKEVVTYVESITQYIPEWGGTSLAGTSFNAEKVGTYTVHFSVATEAKPRAAKAVEAIKAALEKCTTQDCINNAITEAANANDISITEELLTDKSGCMADTERTQALYANQIAWCKTSPDNDCLCVLPNGIDATFKLSPREIQLIKLDDKAQKTKAMPGLSFSAEGDAESLTKIKYYQGSDVDLNDDVELIVNKDGSAEIDILLGLNKKVSALRKLDSDGGLSLSAKEPEEITGCVLPKSYKPAAYCIESKDGSFEPLVFYLKKTPILSERISTKQYKAQPLMFSSTAVRTTILSDKKATYARVRYTTDSPPPRDDWFRVVPDKRGLIQLLGQGSALDSIDLSPSRTRTIQHARLPFAPLAPSAEFVELYDLIVRPQPGETMTLTFYDEHLNEAASMTLNPDLLKEDSGITFPQEFLTQLAAGTPIGGVLNAVGSVAELIDNAKNIVGSAQKTIDAAQDATPNAEEVTP